MSLKHMKSLIVLVVGLLAVGCGKTKLQQEVLRDSIIGEYEHKSEPGDPSTYVFLENGIIEGYVNGKKQKEKYKWSIVDGEIHIVFFDFTRSYRVNKDKSITLNAKVINGKKELYDPI